MFEDLRESIYSGNVPRAQELIQEYALRRVPTKRIIEEAIIPSIEEVGKKFITDDFFITDVLLSARAANAALRAIEKQDRLDGKPMTKGRTRVVIGTVHGDIHNIGKTMLSLLLEANNFDVIDLGVDVTGEKFVKAINKYKPDFVMLSALLMTTMNEMRRVIDLIHKQNSEKFPKIKIMVGGGPVTSEFAREIGADGYADDAYSALEWVKENIELKNSK